MLAIVFQINAAHYALSCENVVEVIPRVVLQPLARPVAGVAGLFVYRGNVMPVVDLCAMIGGYACPMRLSSRIVVVRAGPTLESGLLIGLLAEHVTEARRVEAREHAAETFGKPEFLKQTLLENGQILQMIDTAAMLGSIEAAVPPALGGGA